ncbi:helix-turn-helix domain-containing protein [Rhizobium tubonense]|uniref:Transcriptional regulator n=1 Tax=Rhizobium tubonense TaxID=484088 RepID=A0A2W4CBZ3_9HYPH|nr:helix-turn-helix domain-containing protein [Rhizobium tubonense]PZM08788.1 transcriptional regulator [Rhizobium tubonense]
MSISIQNVDASNVSQLSQIDVGNAVRTARESYGYSLDDLAVTCGLTNREISDVEIGADTDPSKIRRIAAALQIAPSEFLSI